MKIEMYTSTICPFCSMAKRLLKSKGVEFTEINISKDPEQMEFMVRESGGRRTVPQIFVNGRHLGDCMELHAMDKEGLLDQQLGIEE